VINSSPDGILQQAQNGLREDYRCDAHIPLGRIKRALLNQLKQHKGVCQAKYMGVLSHTQLVYFHYSPIVDHK
jgi:hypothetical protein